MKRAGTETECKLIAPDAAAFRGLRAALRDACDGVSRSEVLHIEDTYLDTADWALYRRGYACRIRRTGARFVLALKSLQRSHRMLSIREELECVLARRRAPTARLIARAAAHPHLTAITGGNALNTLFRVRNRRRVWHVTGPGALRAAVSADSFTVSAKGRSRSLFEIEIEMESGSRRLLRRLAHRLVARLHLRVSVRTKFGEGLAVAGLRAPHRRPRRRQRRVT